MATHLKGIKGMPDILPEEVQSWQYLERKLHELMSRYNYQEIRVPVLESTQLFKRSIGDITDIVEKEMYSFDDRNGDSITLRPEGTAGCVRSCIEHALLRNNQQQRLWYMGPMYRYERPQKGRYRQFNQLGVEAFNFDDPEIEAEQLALTARLWRELGIHEIVRLELNTLGDLPSRNAYRAHLVNYFKANEAKLDADSKRRLETNPLRILDSKNPDLQNLISNAPVLLDHVDRESRRHFDNLQQLLQDLGIQYTVNTRIVRGLDYYNRTVYEWVSDHLGSQSAVCSGGRFDNLVESLGGPASTATGFAIGLERLLILLKNANKIPTDSENKAVLICMGNTACKQSTMIAEKLRDALPSISLHTYFGSGSLSKLLQKANKAGAEKAYIVGDDELAAGTVTVKNLCNNEPQQTLTLSNFNSSK